MIIQHLRNATEIIQYAGKTFLIDPMLGDKGSFPAFPNSPREDQNNPLIDLPLSIDEIIKDIDAVIVTHLHTDHWDEKAIDVLPKGIKLFSQNEEDAKVIRDAGFINVEVLNEHTVFHGIKLIKTLGQHGRGEILKIAGLVCGIVFKHPNEKTLYLAGDTVWYKEVEKNIQKYQPDVIIVNAGDNKLNEGGSLIMNDKDAYEVYKKSPDSMIVAVHMEAVNHWGISREELRRFGIENGFSDNLVVPNDGDILKY